jgi:CubicO group peptidase (beta-lactamase class C family)
MAKPMQKILLLKQLLQKFKTMRKIFLFTLTILFYSKVFGQISLSTKQIELLDSIASQDVPKNAPGIATAIIQDGKVIYEKYAGYADLKENTLIKNSTRFNIASNGKQFTALAVLTLIEKYNLKLSDDIRKWFPNLFPNIKESITVQSLLNHTSGIRDCYDLWSLQGYTWWEKSFDNNDVLALIEKQSDLNFEPGTKYLYSNTNYILLALLVEKVSNKTFVEYTNEMFIQLNMPNTSFESDFTKIRGQIARAYFNFDTWTTYKWIWNVCGEDLENVYLLLLLLLLLFIILLL